MKEFLNDEQKFRILAENIPGAIYLCYNDTAYTMLYLNDAVEKLTGYTKTEFLSNKITWVRIIHPNYTQYVYDEINKAIAENRPFHLIYRIQTREGILRWVEEYGVGAKSFENPQLLEGFIVDISERKHTEEELQRTINFNKSLLNATPTPIYWQDREGKFQGCNPAFTKFMGFSSNEIEGKFLPELWQNQMVDIAHQTNLEVLQKMPFQTIETKIKDRNGTLKPILYTRDFFRDQNNNIAGIIGAFIDISEQKQAEEAYLKQQNLLDASEKLSKIGGWEWNISTRMMVWTTEVFRIHDSELSLKKSDSADVIQRSLNCYDPKDREIIQNLFERCVKFGEPYDYVCKFTSFKGRKLWIRTMAHAVYENNKITRILGNIMDITEQKTAQMEKDNLQKKLHQAQKMESIGRLAGGIAHDFNNMLGVILGNLDLINIECSLSKESLVYLNEIKKAAEHSAELTRQLLTFARKQAILPKKLNLNEKIPELLPIIRRLIGENIDLVWSPAPDLWLIKFDPMQVNQIIVNLCTNARDAIKGPGKIRISTNNMIIDELYLKNNPSFKIGDYVVITISDTGSGMDKETISHLFEPFFTTKTVGKGTGMGLSTVYGIIQQNNAFIDVFSEINEGTTFKIYIPRENRFSDVIIPQKNESILNSKNETILVVEDEVSLLELTIKMLQNLGYIVLSAHNPTEALQIITSNPKKIDLLLSDLMLPEIDGKTLSEKILMQKPNIKCLFMSGYPEKLTENGEIFEINLNFIQKPFSMQDLALKIRQVLNN